ncbi:MAG: SdrD B-like domain-containing protein, partial [Bacteroidota bacterium]
GIDLAFVNFPEPKKSTVPQTFTFAPASVSRTATLSLFFSSVEGTVSQFGLRPNSIEVTVGSTVTKYTDLLGSHDGQEWDTQNLSIVIPAGVSTVTVQAFSRDDLGRWAGGSSTTFLPASLFWLVAGLSVPGGCTGRIGDFVWNDLDSDGIQDLGEPGIPGVTVNLRNTPHGPIIATTVPDANGHYEFNNLCHGDYCVDIVQNTLPPNCKPSVNCDDDNDGRKDDDDDDDDRKDVTIMTTASLSQRSVLNCPRTTAKT